MYTQRDATRPPLGVSLHATPGDPDTELVSRALAVLAVAGIAVIHIANSEDAYASAHYIFWLYLAVIVAAVPVLALLVHWRSPLVWAATAMLASGPLLGYLWSRTIGLPNDRGDIGDWLNPVGMSSLFVEASLITLSVTRLSMVVRAGSMPHRLSGSVERVRMLPLTPSGSRRSGSHAA